MDRTFADVLQLEMENALIELALEGEAFNPMWHCVKPAVVLLEMVRPRMERDLKLSDLVFAVQTSRSMKLTRLNQAYALRGMSSDLAVEFSLYNVNRNATLSAKHFHKHLKQFGEKPRPRIARAQPDHLALTLQDQKLVFDNVGYGVATDLHLLGVTAPDWITVNWSEEGLTASVRAENLPGGVYQATLRFRTSGGDVPVPVVYSSCAYALPSENQIDPSEWMEWHPDLDEEATRQELHGHLLGLGYQQIPGGMFVRPEDRADASFTQQWLLTPDMIERGTLPALGYPKKVTLLDDEDNEFPVTCENGALGGASLKTLLELHDAAVPYMRVRAQQHLGRLRLEFTGIEEWRALEGHSFILTGNRQNLTHPEILNHLIKLSESNCKVDIYMGGAGEFPSALVQQHRSGRLTVFEMAQSLPFRLYAQKDQSWCYCPLPTGRINMGASLPKELHGATPLGGVDYRERAWTGDESGLLDLELSVQMQQVAEALTALNPSDSKGPKEVLTPAIERKLREDLFREARKAGVDLKPFPAAPLLKKLGLKPAQVLAYDGPIKLTRGGYLILNAHRTNKSAAIQYAVRAYGGIIHHSQLRKLTECFMGRHYDPKSFMNESRAPCGWGGYGYRRPPMVWEPESRQLPKVLQELLDRYEGKQEQVANWARTHLTMKEDKLEQALREARQTWKPKPAASSAPAPVKPQQKTIQAGPIRTEPAIKPPPAPQSPAPAKEPPVQFKGKLEPEPLYTSKLPDPRTQVLTAVKAKVLQIVQHEGPMTQSYLIKRYGVLCGRPDRLIETHVKQALQECLTEHQIVQERGFDAVEGSLVLRHLGQKFVPKECKNRQPEQIPLGELLELGRTLRRQNPRASSKAILQEVARVYKLAPFFRKHPLAEQQLAAQLLEVHKSTSGHEVVSGQWY